MYTVKIHWWREEKTDEVEGTVDQSTLYIPADEVRVLARILNPADEMRLWHEGEFFNYQALSAGGRYEARLIQVVRKGELDTWYLASRAWLLGPTGDTIERIAP